MPLQFGIILPYGDPRITAELAQLAEQSGWDGVFVGDAILSVDPLIQLAACASITTRIRLGTMVLAAPLRRPWHLASESLALDMLSNGRLILGLGTGATWMGWQHFPHAPLSQKKRARMLEETVEIVHRLHERQQFDFAGPNFVVNLSSMDLQHFPPRSVQQPHVPIWLPTLFTRSQSLARALNAEGMQPFKLNEKGEPVTPTHAELRQLVTWVNEQRPPSAIPYDFIIEDKSYPLPPERAAAMIAAWADAGATWWIESTWEMSVESLRQIIARGPAR